MSDLARFDTGHRLEWIPGVFERANAVADGTIESLFTFDGAAGGPNFLRVDYLSLALEFVASDDSAVATLGYYLGTSPAASALLIAGMGGPIGQTAPSASSQLTLPFVTAGPIAFFLVCRSAVTSLSSCSATLAASVAYDLPS